MVAPGISIPPFFHWYPGDDPPLIGVAVKITVFPEQDGLEEGEIVIPAVSAEFTTMVTAFEVAGLPVAQFALELSTQVITSPLVGT